MKIKVLGVCSRTREASYITGALKLTRELYDYCGTSAPFGSKPKLSLSYTAEETSIEIVGITELVKCADSLVPATIVTMLLCLAH